MPWEMEYFSAGLWWKIGFLTVVGLVVYRYEDKVDAERTASALCKGKQWRVERAASAVKDK